MKWKMAENSLFAILLRSPWWIALGIGVLLVLLMRVLLPPDYATPAMLGSFPFFVIAAMAAWKQLRAPSPAQIEQTVQRLQAMNSREFGAAIEAAAAQGAGGLHHRQEVAPVGQVGQRVALALHTQPRLAGL